MLNALKRLSIIMASKTAGLIVTLSFCLAVLLMLVACGQEARQKALEPEPAPPPVTVLPHPGQVYYLGAMRQLQGNAKCQELGSAAVFAKCDVTKEEDVANAALWLASDESGYTNGHVLTIDAGITTGSTIEGPAFAEYQPMIRQAGKTGLIGKTIVPTVNNHLYPTSTHKDLFAGATS